VSCGQNHAWLQIPFCAHCGFAATFRKPNLTETDSSGYSSGFVEGLLRLRVLGKAGEDGRDGRASDDRSWQIWSNVASTLFNRCHLILRRLRVLGSAGGQRAFARRELRNVVAASTRSPRSDPWSGRTFARNRTQPGRSLNGSRGRVFLRPTRFPALFYGCLLSNWWHDVQFIVPIESRRLSLPWHSMHE